MTTRRSTSESVYDRLRAMILAADLPAGTTLRPSALRDDYGFGLTPLREALKRLQSEYLVTAQFNHGFRVADTTLPELEEIGQARAMLDTEMLLTAMRQGGEDWEGAVVAAHYQLGKLAPPDMATDAETLAAWETRHSAFHTALTSACTSVWLNRMADFLSAQMRRYHSNILADLQRAAARDPALVAPADRILGDVMGLDHHSRLMEAALARDPAPAARLMREHVDLAARAYIGLQRLLTQSSAA
ncbi:DNA-binding transcriptional regulator, GntR family [Salinihabitans flavidus]|uniref:DNA-binding transcriptional regulator, GntR family n=1 Tax=Salinihabitans flavidus TaxID=569882 RepID=A0A1H8U4A0_9RHOB|nr:GntR family transcriptional regulator [Salinihabitans flavidus]SEO98100.1 DNA-binding transcriptional regulator, GntR family [Salinihabitans flavidus]